MEAPSELSTAGSVAERTVDRRSRRRSRFCGSFTSWRVAVELDATVFLTGPGASPLPDFYSLELEAESTATLKRSSTPLARTARTVFVTEGVADFPDDL